MTNETVLCIPGPWADRSAFLKAIVTLEPVGDFMFLGQILADIKGKDHVCIDFCEPYSEMEQAFRLAGQGRLTEATLASVNNHLSTVYLHFPFSWLEQRNRLSKFTRLLQRAGGIAIKVESSGTAHSWESWFELLSGSTFDAYCSCVTLVGDPETQRYYSCGMHHFKLPECSVPTTINIEDAADLINQFNLYQIVEEPLLQTGHTFSLSSNALHFTLHLVQDSRHSTDELFHNKNGIWDLRLTA